MNRNGETELYLATVVVVGDGVFAVVVVFAVDVAVDAAVVVGVGVVFLLLLLLSSLVPYSRQVPQLADGLEGFGSDLS